MKIDSKKQEEDNERLIFFKNVRAMSPMIECESEAEFQFGKYWTFKCIAQ